MPSFCNKCLLWPSHCPTTMMKIYRETKVEVFFLRLYKGLLDSSLCNQHTKQFTSLFLSVLCRVKFPMARQADLVKIGKEAFDSLDKMLQQQRQQLLPADQEAKHYELLNALMRRWPKPQMNRDIGAQSTATVVITETKNKRQEHSNFREVKFDALRYYY